MSLNDNHVTFPEPDAVSFSKTERARWNKNLEALVERLVQRGLIKRPTKEEPLDDTLPVIEA